jgi:hypothetical protein
MEISRNVFFSNKADAEKMCNGWGAAPPPKERDAVLMDDGSVWLLEKVPVPLYHSTEDMERKEALAKLSAREKTLLGIK